MTPTHRDSLVGEKLRVPKGTMVKRYGPDWPIKEEPAKRSLTVRVTALLGPYAHAPQFGTRVEWIGRGGYSRSALLTDLRSVNPS